MSYKGKKILAVVPARGGSKGIPRKNMKLLGNKPLVAHILDTLVTVDYIDKIIFTSDNQELLDIAARDPKIEPLERPKALAQDNITLDPVVFHAYEQAKSDQDFDYILTFQPTSPLIKIETIKRGIEELVDNSYDTVISVVDDRHLRWIKTDEGYKPLYDARVNRQKMDPVYKETGSIIGCSKEVISPKSRIGKSIHLLELSGEEAIDIDNYADWALAENYIHNPKLGFITIGDKEIGLGHVYRTLSIANRLSFKPKFFVPEGQEIAYKKIKAEFYDVITFNSDQKLTEALLVNDVDLIINDTLDTSKAYIETLKKDKRFVVTFEDFGEGSELSDLSFNALYENTNPAVNNYFGYKYICLRDEFLFAPKKKITKEVENVLITFGGTDPNNLTEFVFKALKDTAYKLEIIVGPGYHEYDQLKKVVGNRAKIYNSVDKMSEHMLKSDLVVTSNGRTTFEVASLGVPALAIAQNDREMKHLFGDVTKTILLLGLHSTVNKEKFINEFEALVNNYELRQKINKRMLDLNLAEGLNRVINLILNKYNDNKFTF